MPRRSRRLAAQPGFPRNPGPGENLQLPSKSLLPGGGASRQLGTPRAFCLQEQADQGLPRHALQQGKLRSECEPNSGHSSVAPRDSRATTPGPGCSNFLSISSRSQKTFHHLPNSSLLGTDPGVAAVHELSPRTCRWLLVSLCQEGEAGLTNPPVPRKLCRTQETSLPIISATLPASLPSAQPSPLLVVESDETLTNGFGVDRKAGGLAPAMLGLEHTIQAPAGGTLAGTQGLPER